MLLFCILFFFNVFYSADRPVSNQLKLADRVNLVIAKPFDLSDEQFQAQMHAIMKSAEEEAGEKAQGLKFVKGRRVEVCVTANCIEKISPQLQKFFSQDDEDMQTVFVPSAKSDLSSAAAASSGFSVERPLVSDTAPKDETKLFLDSQGIEIVWVKDFYQKRKESIYARFEKINERYIPELLLILSKSILKTTDVTENEIRLFQVFRWFYKNIWVEVDNSFQQKLVEYKQIGKFPPDFEIDSKTFFNAVITALQKNSIPLQTNEDGSVAIPSNIVRSLSDEIIDNFTNMLEKQHKLVSAWKAKKTVDFLLACRISKEKFEALTIGEKFLNIFIASILVDGPIAKKYSKEPWKDCKRLESKVLELVEPLRQKIVVYKRHQGKTDPRLAEEIFNYSKSVMLCELVKKLAQPELSDAMFVLDDDRICWNEDLVKELLVNIAIEAIFLGKEGSSDGSNNHNPEFVALIQRAQAISVQEAKVQEKKEQERQRAVLVAQKKAAQPSKAPQETMQQILEEEKRIAAASRAIRDQRQAKKNELAAKIAGVKAQQEQEKQERLKAISEEKKQKKQASQAYQAAMQQHENSLQDIEIDDSQVQVKQALKNQREKEYQERSRVAQRLDQSVNVSEKSHGLNVNAQPWIPKATLNTDELGNPMYVLPYSQRTSSCAILGPPPDLQINTYGQLDTNNSCSDCLSHGYPIADFNVENDDAYTHSLYDDFALHEQQSINGSCSCPDCLYQGYPIADASHYAASYNRQPPLYNETFGL